VTLLLSLCTLLLGLAASITLPLDDHELLVAQMAREMDQRGDWVVPVFNREPRLNKPPLNPWIAIVASHLDPWASGVEARHARVAPVLGATALIPLTVYLGARLLTRRIALGSAALLASTTGMLNFCYSARPDMLYATLCTAALACFVSADSAPPGSRRQLAGGLGLWGCFGLATLCKGPHFPGLFLLGLVIHLLRRRASWRELRDVLRPAWGMLLYLLIALPWWVLLIHRVGYAAFSTSQLAGNVYELDWLYALSPERFVRMSTLLTPWFLLFPAAIAVLWRPGRCRDGVRLIGWVCLVTLIGLMFASKQRGYYALPLIPALALLLGAGLLRVLALADRSQRLRAGFALVAGGHAIVAAVVLFVLGWRAGSSFPGTRLLLLVAAPAAIVAFGLARRLRPLPRPADNDARAAVVAVWLTLFALALGAAAWKPQPAARAAFARQVAELVPADQPIYSATTRSNVVVFYGRRFITTLPPGPVGEALGAIDVRRAYVILQARAIPALPSPVSARVLLTVERDDPNDAMALVYLEQSIVR